MNVKPNDLARIVNDPRNSNRIVRVLRAGVRLGDWTCEALQTLSGDGFVADGITFWRAITIAPGVEVCIPDANLRPLYDGDADDEMLRQTGKPVESVREVIEAITA